MAVKQDLVFSIDGDGNITIEVEGVKGKDCTEITRELEEALGIVVDRNFTAEYYQETEDKVRIKLGG